MWIRRLEIQGFRNIEQVALELSPTFNLFVGANGSGKSSLLEALNSLSSGHSFRTNKKVPVIRDGSSAFVVYGEVIRDGSPRRVGIQKSLDGSTVVKIDGRAGAGQGEAAVLVPVVGITPEADDLLAGGAKARQAFLDWTLFHVEPAFRQTWKSYRRVVQQRNSALRQRSPVAAVRSWDESLAVHGETLDGWRKAALARIVPLVERFAETLLPDCPIEFAYRQGWPKQLRLVEALEHSLETDRKMGFTHCGPHRADVVLRSGRSSVVELLSRGQRKQLTIALRLAQAADFVAVTGSAPILFIDDLAAELDYTGRQRAVCELEALALQVLITGTSAEEFPDNIPESAKLFHVEQGSVSNML